MNRPRVSGQNQSLFGYAIEGDPCELASDSLPFGFDPHPTHPI